jgi:hypothetical protein
MEKTGLVIGLVADAEKLLEQAKDEKGYAPLFAKDLAGEGFINQTIFEKTHTIKGEKCSEDLTAWPFY